MLDRLLRQRSRPPDGPDVPGESLRSHVFPRFLKWLSGRDRPSVLDLGRLSGANIEIFARLGCRVQVEDLLGAVEEKKRTPAGPAPTAEPMAAAPLPRVAEAAPAPTAAGPAGSPADHIAAGTPGDPAPGAAGPNGTGATAAQSAGAAGTGTAPGIGRPTRHIVLPPRVFSRAPVTGSRGTNGQSSRSQYTLPRPTPLTLPTSFAYPDASFDAIVGWDLFNYYDPETARRLGPDVVRLLRPGGLVFATFHARREEGPDGPARHKIVDESHLQIEPHTGPPRARHLYQNRDIEKTFAGLKIVELYFLRHGVREMLLEKRVQPGAPPAIGGPARPRPRFRIE